ncbi:MAG: UDP-N-acetylmuramoyl-tripeptide--D-alanyl-D-alanine ligase [Verrucomicrobiota bacterium]
MTPLSLSDISKWTGGALLTGVPSQTVAGYSTDTRKVAEGELFFALKGDKFNAHKFLDKAIEGGASAMVISELPLSSEAYDGGTVHVKDTLKALQNLALNYRRQILPEVFAVGVTGSNGKTSTKDFLTTVLGAAGEVNATNGNLNNHIGLPMTVLDTEPNHQFGVWEMGMNHPGEIGPLAEIAKPNAAVITNVGTAHIEHMKTREAIADEKGALARAVTKDGFCVMPANDDYFDHIAAQVSCEMIGVGGDDSVVRADQVVSHSDRTEFVLHIDGSEAAVVLPIPGAHMVTNSLLAAAVGWKVGLTVEQIAERLSHAEVTGGRLELIQHGDYRILNDSYNANPDSVAAALETLVETKGDGRAIAVLGFMGELGELEEVSHREIGEIAAKLDVDSLLCVGERTRPIIEGAGSDFQAHFFESHESAAAYLGENVTEGDLILVKGSRGAKMETVIELLTSSI